MKYFEILGITKTWYGSASKVYPEQIQVDRHGKETKVTKLNDRTYARFIPKFLRMKHIIWLTGNIIPKFYARVLIKHIRS